MTVTLLFFFSSRRRHTRCLSDWSSDVCSSDLMGGQPALVFAASYPERIHRLVVMNSLVLWDENTSWEIQVLRSEERRVGKECRSRWSPCEKKKIKRNKIRCTGAGAYSRDSKE